MPNAVWKSLTTAPEFDKNMPLDCLSRFSRRAQLGQGWDYISPGN